MSIEPLPPIAVSLGDPAGIGPEIIAETWRAREQAQLAPFFVVGGAGAIRAAAALRGVDCPLVPIAEPEEAALAFNAGLPVMAGLEADYHPGTPTKESARAALVSLEYATRFALAGLASALVTGPVAKTQLAEIGFGHPGQTEFLADACGLSARDAVMMLAGPTLRTVPLTVHCALSEVPGLISHDLICHKARIVADALERDFGIAGAHLVVAGLNPHAGEGGKFGHEEVRIIEPAIAALREEGYDVSGPYPADAMFTPRARSQYHAALCMYHDQALVPLKALEFDEGVNVTLGLPIVRTSPDHGTAFDIAGKGLAEAGAMIAALRMAGECAQRRAPRIIEHG